MKVLCGTQDSIDRAGFDADSAANALVLIDEGHAGSLLFGSALAHRQGLDTQQVGHGEHGAFTAGRAEIDGGFTAGDSIGERTAAGVAALTTLALWQQAIDLFGNRIAFHVKSD